MSRFRLRGGRPAGLGGLLLALAAGAAAGLAHPPFGVLPGIAGFALLIHSLDTATPFKPLRSAFARGWAAGFAYFLVGTWWVGEAFLVDFDAHGWQAPFAVVILSAGLGLFWGAAGAVYRRFAPSHIGRILFFAAVLSLFEWARGHVLTGFPWNLPGEAWRAGSAPSQAAALIGAYGLTFVTVAVGAAPAVLFQRAERRERIAAMAAAGLVLAALWGGGAWRLSRPAPPDTGLLVRVVQPNIPQAVKWTPEAFQAIVDRYVEMTAAPPRAGRPADIVVWPESAIPESANALLAPGAWTLPAITSALSPGQALLAGLYREEDGAYFNSLVALRRTGQGLAVLGVYDKHRLVPFGEYLPMEGFLARVGLRQLAGLGESFSAGPPPAPISPAGLPPVQPLVCYESLFPGFTGRGAARPAWIANVSNDAWFGRTSGPWQHLNLASYRAIEEGLPMVRATPTGVSAVIDAFGRPRARLGLGERGVIDAPLPAALAPTPYSRWGDSGFWIFCVAGLASGFGRGGRRRFGRVRKD